MARGVSLFDCAFFFFNDTATTEIYTLSLHDALPIWSFGDLGGSRLQLSVCWRALPRSEEHTSELQSRQYLVCRLLLEKKKSRALRRQHLTRSNAQSAESVHARRP